jgi:hypothetical protein
MTADRQLDDRRGLPYFGLRAPITRRHSPESGFQPDEGGAFLLAQVGRRGSASLGEP